MADSRPDATHHVRLLPSGETPPLSVDPGKHHELVVQVEGDEDPQAMTPEAAGAEGGVSLPKLGEKFSVNPVMGSATGSVSERTQRRVVLGHYVPACPDPWRVLLPLPLPRCLDSEDCRLAGARL